MFPASSTTPDPTTALLEALASSLYQEILLEEDPVKKPTKISGVSQRGIGEVQQGTTG